MKTPDEYLKSYPFWKDSELLKDLIGNVQNDTINNTVQELQKEKVNEQVISSLYKVLKDLVDLKGYKDTKGKDEYYLTQQPILWDNARKILKDCESIYK